MPQYRFSRLARLDLIEIADYTGETWGLEQAERYMDSLDDCFKQLAQSPGIGRACDRIRIGYRRMEHKSHVVIYRVEKDGIFISRILHQRMLPSRHFFGDR